MSGKAMSCEGGFGRTLLDSEGDAAEEEDRGD